MMSAPIFITLAVFLILLLVLITRREEAEEQASAKADERTQRECRDALQHPELVLRIFSREDMEFISLMRSPRLQRTYQEERRKVALHWVRRTSREVSRIMRTHRLISRQSQNLDGFAEAKLLFQYLKLRAICGLLIFLIIIFGPHALHDLASYAGELYQLIGRAMPDAMSANGVASSENSATP